MTETTVTTNAGTFAAALPTGGALIGGIGVSGGSAEQDEACARAGLQAVGLG